MLLIVFLLYPTVFCSDLRINDYLIRIENTTLKGIRTTETSHSALDLSNLGLRSIEATAFVNLTNLKSLSLADNALVALPEFGFAELENLESLTLANNNITDFVNAFVGLGRLKSLNITDNPLRPHWNPLMFNGLNASCNIWTRGTFPRYLMATSLISYPPYMAFSEYLSPSPTPFPKLFTNHTKYRLCIQDDVVQTLEKATTMHSFDEGCGKIVHPSGHFDLSNLRIRDFDEFWYLADSSLVTSIDIGWNNVERISKAMLNNFPKNIANVNLTRNKIERLERDVIVNRWIETLDLSNNVIGVIEEDALKKTRVKTLILTGNMLRDINFAASLPYSALNLRLERNEIEAVTSEAFEDWRVNKIDYLDLGGNRIAELRRGALRGFPLLTKLKLDENRLTRIEPGAFHFLYQLISLDLCCNSLVVIPKGLFAGFPTIYHINLRGNRLTRVTRDLFGDLSNDFLRYVDLSFNNIESVEAGSFAKVPKASLSLSHNRISRIEKGTFGLLRRERSHLKANTTVGSVENIFSESGSGLRDLSLDGNRIERLESGALFGMEKSMHTVVNLSGADLELIQPGVFDDL